MLPVGLASNAEHFKINTCSCRTATEATEGVGSYPPAGESVSAARWRRRGDGVSFAGTRTGGQCRPDHHDACLPPSCACRAVHSVERGSRVGLEGDEDRRFGRDVGGGRLRHEARRRHAHYPLGRPQRLQLQWRTVPRSCCAGTVVFEFVVVAGGDSVGGEVDRCECGTVDDASGVDALLL